MINLPATKKQAIDEASIRRPRVMLISIWLAVGSGADLVSFAGARRMSAAEMMNAKMPAPPTKSASRTWVPFLAGDDWFMTVEPLTLSISGESQPPLMREF